MLDIFNGDAFSVISLTGVVNELKFRSNRLGELGLFGSGEGVPTLTIAIERLGDIIQLVRPSPRGTPGVPVDLPKRKLQSLTIPHFSRPWSVYADEVQGVRAYGSEVALNTVQGVTARKLGYTMSDFELTEEYSRLGAITGIITYADGSTLDLYQAFDVVQPAVIHLALDAATPVDGVLRKATTGIIRQMRRALGGVNFNRVWAFCGDQFFDALLQHAEVRKSYFTTGMAEWLRTSYVGENRGSNPIYDWGGIIWENYGAVDDAGEGALIGIAPTECHFVPMGVPGLFRTYYAPADYIETVNTIGKRFYAKQIPDDWGKSILGEVQSNPLHICTRPGVLLRASLT